MRAKSCRVARTEWLSQSSNLESFITESTSTLWGILGLCARSRSCRRWRCWSDWFYVCYISLSILSSLIHASRWQSWKGSMRLCWCLRSCDRTWPCFWPALKIPWPIAYWLIFGRCWWLTLVLASFDCPWTTTRQRGWKVALFVSRDRNGADWDSVSLPSCPSLLFASIFQCWQRGQPLSYWFIGYFGTSLYFWRLHQWPNQLSSSIFMMTWPLSHFFLGCPSMPWPSLAQPVSCW